MNKPELNEDILNNLSDMVNESDVLENLVSEEVAELVQEGVISESEAKEVRKTKSKAKKTTAPKEEVIEVQNNEGVKKWIDVYLANYEGKSKEAMLLQEEGSVKENYKGNSYIPWAVMERLVYMSDPEAIFENVLNAEGGLVHTDKAYIESVVRAKENNVDKENSSSAVIFAHFVRVKLVFMGKTFIEDYPIQDEKYESLKAYHQNAVNRALQRAKTKLGARGSGLGLKLYEAKDLQFDEIITDESKKPKLDTIKKETKPEVVKTITEINKKSEVVEQKPEVIVKQEEVVVEQKPEVVVEQKPEVVVEQKPEVVVEQELKQKNINTEESDELIDIILNDDEQKVNLALQAFNTSIMLKYQFVLSRNDSREELIEKINNFDNIGKFTESFKKKVRG